MKRWNRQNELLADAAERASVAAHLLGAARYPADKLRRAWQLFLAGQMHDILPGTCIPKAYEHAWNDQIPRTESICRGFTECGRRGGAGSTRESRAFRC